MALSEKRLLERALDAEERLDKAKARIDDLESRLKAAMGADPSTATRALSWVGRAETSERLVAEVLRLVDQRSLPSTDLPAGWVARAEAQMRSVAILKRDQAKLGEKPPDEEYWTRFRTEGVYVRDSAGNIIRRR